MERICATPAKGTRDETALLRQAIEACLRARRYARREDGLGLTMAAALLRCDLAELGEAGTIQPLIG